MTRLRECLFELAASERPLIADLDQVGFIDSAGLSALRGRARRRLRRQPARGLRRPKIRQLFRLAGLNRRIPLARTREEAWQRSGQDPR